ncbi:unnamed protein product [Sphagnum tenellum]
MGEAMKVEGTAAMANQQEVQEEALTESDMPIAGVMYGSEESMENLEEISEDWVSLFLDSSILDKEETPPSVPCDFGQFSSIIKGGSAAEECNVQFSSHDVLSNSTCFINSIDDDQASHSNSIMASSPFMHSSLGQLDTPQLSDTAVDVNPTLQDDIAHVPNGPLFSAYPPLTSPSVTTLCDPVASAFPSFLSMSPPTVFDSDAEACAFMESLPVPPMNAHDDGTRMIAPTNSSLLSPASSLTQVSAESSSRIGADHVWRSNDTNPDMPVVPKCELIGDLSSGSESPTSPVNPIFSEVLGCSLNSQLPHGNKLQDEEGGLGEAVFGNETALSGASPPTVEAQQNAPETQKFSMLNLHGIGNAIKVGSLGRSGDRKKRPEVGRESDKGQKSEGEWKESLNLQTSGSFDEMRSDQSDAENKEEGGEDDSGKRQARLMRNRESAQLSRQRKKVYVSELEGRLRTMAATVAELNATISHLTAENVNLRRQLGYYYPPPGICPRPGVPMVGQQVLPMTPYPGMVGGRPIYPAGQVPSLPIPRLKTQPPPARTSKRSNVLGSKEETSGDKKRARRKLAAAASVAVMSLLCVAMLLGPFNDTQIISGPGWTPLEEGEYGPEREGITRIYSSRPSDRKKTKIINLEKKGARMEAGTRSPWQQLLGMNSSVSTSSERGSQGQPDCFGPLEAPIFVGSTFPVNMTEPFAASLFVPRDNRLVQVNGNLIIQAVMAGDKAAMQSSGKTRKAGIKKGKALKTVSTKALEAKGARLPTQAVLVADKAVAANQKSQHGNSNTVPSVVQPGSLQQWVMGGLQGPVLTTGMCTELFQFDTSPVTSAPSEESSNAAAKDVAESVASEAAQGNTHNNASSKNSVPLMPQSRRNPFAVPLPPTSPSGRVSGAKNGSDPTVEKLVREQLHQQGEMGNQSSMVVSVLAGPQEFADTSRRKGAKGMSRIFVVVLVDGVKYVTYSCVLPSTGPQPHIVTA